MIEEKIRENLGTQYGVFILPLGNLHQKIKGLPRNILNHIFSLATLPCAFEGAGTASLVLNIGCPYLHLLSRDMRGKSDSEVAESQFIVP